jgi:hypothetical protein
MKPRLYLSAWSALTALTALTAQAQQAVQSPHGRLQEECATCHSSSGWTPAKISKSFDHAKHGFTLVGAHAQTTCRACHQALNFSDASPACASCHEDVHRGELGVNCATCHTSRSFIDRSAMARNHQLTRFPLEGSHLVTDCRDCHKPAAQGQMTFRAVSSDCVSCHRSSYDAATDPNHVAGGFPLQCSQCHAPTAWTEARFNHDASGFPLTGGHRAVACAQCHVGNKFTGTPAQCVGCHQQNYDQTTLPNHVQAGFPTDCASCHGTTSWTAAFDHNGTQFPLTGAHRAATCSQCHADGIYRGKPTTCISCHQTDYNGAADPKHTLPSFVSTCTQCHTTTAWSPSTFKHSATQFPLTGVHLTVPCAKCHINGLYKGTTSTCQSCHLPDFNTTTSPNHVQLGWPQTCTTCHSGSSNTTAWNAGVTLPSQYHTMFSVSHQGARGVCTQCHNTTNYAQSTCSNHHHPPTCTYLNQNTCRD